MIDIQCPNCSAPYRIEEKSLGYAAQCKRCGHRFAFERPNPDTVGRQVSVDTAGGKSAVAGAPATVGRFQIKERLGAGSFGAVYRAYDPFLEREVALKLPHPAALATEADQVRFLREPKAAANLRHPNIVPVYDAGVDQGQFYIASAFIKGQTLERVIDERPPNFHDAAKLVIALAEALDYAHAQGIIHRDVKPANIMVDEKGTPLLMDFGLARLRESEAKLTHDKTVLGTPAYMPPEQAAGRHSEVGPLSDQYSLGVVLYELLCRDRPFHGLPGQVLYLVVHEEIPTPRSHDAQIPKDLETICLKAMSKPVTARYASCSELALDLRRWLNHEPIKAKPPTFVSRLTRWIQREPRFAIAALAAVLASLAASAALVVSNHQQVKARIAAEHSALVERDLRGQLETSLNDAETARSRATIAERRAVQRAQTEAAARQSEAAARENEHRQRIAAESTSYSLRINRAQDEWKAGHEREARRLLHACPLDHRGWEWHYLRRVFRASAWNWQAHGGITAAAVSTDGRLATCGGESGSKQEEIRIWSIADGRETLCYKGHPSVKALAFSPRGDLVASSNFKEVQLWRPESGDCVLRIPTAVEHRVSFSRDGSRVAIAVGGAVEVWDVDERRMVTALNGIGHPFSFAPVGDAMACIHGSMLHYWDLRASDKSKPAWSARFGRSYGCLAIDPKGSYVAVAAQGVTIYDALTGKEHRRLPHGDHALCFSNDGRLIASAVYSEPRGTVFAGVSVWDVTSGALVATYEEHEREKTERIIELCFSADNRLLLSAAWDGRVAIWDLDTTKPAREIRVAEASPILRDKGHGDAESKDGRYYAREDNRVIEVRDRSEGKRLSVCENFPGKLVGLALSPAGNRLAAACDDGTIQLWDCKTGLDVFKAFEGRGGESEKPYSDISFSDSGEELVLSHRGANAAVSLNGAPAPAWRTLPFTSANPGPDSEKARERNEEPTSAGVARNVRTDVPIARPLSPRRPPPTEELVRARAELKKRRDLKGAERLFEEAQHEGVSEAQRYALFERARLETVKAGRLERALEQLEECERWFDLDRLEAKLVLIEAASPFHGDSLLLRVAEQVAEECAGQDRYDEAVAAIKCAFHSAIKLGDTAARARTAAQEDKLSRLSYAYDAISEDFARLRSGEDNPEAHLSVGRFLCFAKEDWQRGIEHLAQSLGRLRECAELEAAGPSSESDYWKLGDAWRLASEEERDKTSERRQQPSSESSVMNARAEHWYGLARAEENATYLSDLPGPSKVYNHTGEDITGPRGSALRVNGVHWPHALYLMTPAQRQASIEYKIADAWQRFRADVAICDGAPDGQLRYVFKVLVNGKVVWKSTEIAKAGPVQRCDIEVRGARALTLAVQRGPGALSGHPVWIEPRLVPQARNEPERGRGKK